jgi:hypothetical protein
MPSKLILTVLALLMGAADALACADFSRAPSSRWATRQANGVQMLVTPCGDPFLSIGVNIVNSPVPIEKIAGQRYEWRRFYRSEAEFYAETRRRLASWGFNTGGAWSAPPAKLDMPSIVILGVGVEAKFHWFDPFDPATERRVRTLTQKLVAPYRNDPRRIGYFTDNEMGWWSGALFHYYSKQPMGSHTKRRWVAHLRSHYGDDWRRFLADFRPPEGVTSWDALLATRADTKLKPGGEGIQAVRGWTALVATRYYEVIEGAFRDADPDALLFGDRLPIYYDPVAVKPMARHTDVLGVNYNPDAGDGWVAPYFFDGLRNISGGKPVLVSEWFFAAHENRSGNKNKGHLMTVATQELRARGAAAATRNFAAIPELVGWHWFQYPDHPSGGRADGEDYNFGLVDMQDRPYEGLVAALAAANGEAPRLHDNATPLQGRDLVVPHAHISMDDHTLADWPKPSALLPPLTPKPGEIAFGEAYLAWDDDGISFATIGQDYYDIDLFARPATFPLEEAYRFAIGIDAGAGPRRFTLAFTPPEQRGKDYPIMKALLCEGSPQEEANCATPSGGKAVYFGSDQPRIVAEARLPWSALGISAPPANGKIRVEIAGTAWHRARWMSLTGAAPAEAMGNTANWREVTLAR